VLLRLQLRGQYGNGGFLRCALDPLHSPLLGLCQLLIGQQAAAPSTRSPWRSGCDLRLDGRHLRVQLLLAGLKLRFEGDA